jgi:hypothetical protein
VDAGAGWGLMHSALNQYAPFGFQGAEDDVETYRMIARLTGGRAPGPTRDTAGRPVDRVARGVPAYVHTIGTP